MKAKKENKSSNLKQKLIKSFYITAIIFGSFGLSQKAFAVDLGEAYPKTRESDKNLNWENYKKGPIKLDYTTRGIGMAWEVVPKYNQVTIEHLQRVAGHLNDLTYLSKSNFDKIKTIEKKLETIGNSEVSKDELDKKANAADVYTKADADDIFAKKSFEHLNNLNNKEVSKEELDELKNKLDEANEGADENAKKAAKEALYKAEKNNKDKKTAEEAKENLKKALGDSFADKKEIEDVKNSIKNMGDNLTNNYYNKEETSALVNSGTSAAVALAGLHALPYDPERPSQLSAAFGLYKGSKSIAVGLNHYINENTLVTGAVSTAFGSGKLGGLAVNVGITYRFGKGKDGYTTIKERREKIDNMQKEIQDLRELVNALQSEIKNLKK